MNKIIHLSLARKSVPVFMDVVQGTTAPAIEFILDDYTPPSNARARIYIKKEGGEVYNNCTLSGNVVTYTPTAGSFDVPGQCVAQLELVQSSTVAVSWRIFVTVEPNLISGSAAPASTEFGALTSLIQSAQAYDGIIGANNITGYNNRQGWINLTSGQDLNTVTAVGVYQAASDSIAGSLLNSPYPYGFKMIVESLIANNSRVKQTIYPTANANSWKIYVRQTLDGGSTWTDWKVQPLRDEVNAIANQGAKNLLPITATTTTTSGLTFTVNSDGTVTLDGTTTDPATFILQTTKQLPSAPYSIVVSGFGTEDTTGGGVYAQSGLGASGASAGTRLTSSKKDGIYSFTNECGRVWLYFVSGMTFDNVTISVMVIPQAVQDTTYVPYGMSNAELTGEILDANTLYNATMESAYSSGSVRYLKFGRLVVFSGIFNLTGTETNGTIIATGLPTALVGNASFRGSNNSLAGSTVLTYLTTGGELRHSGTNSETGSARVSGAYISYD